jgi:hypothetical protein
MSARKEPDEDMQTQDKNKQKTIKEQENKDCMTARRKETNRTQTCNQEIVSHKINS